MIGYLSSIDSANTTDKLLTYKLAMLLALTSAARSHEMIFLNTKFLVKHHTEYSFHFGKPTKVARPGRPRPPLKFSHFTADKNLCVCHHIDLDLSRSQTWRSKQSQLLLSFVEPDKLVQSSMVSRWVIETLSLAGIDTKTFSGHSTRYASSSKASEQGVPLKEILKRAYWSNKTIFEQRCKKDIEKTDLENSGNFESAIPR